MIGLEDRQGKVQQIEAAQQAGARQETACQVAGVSSRTLQRWKRQDGLHTGDRRPGTHHPPPAHAFSLDEREAVLAMANEPRFADLLPARIVPLLADEGVYLGSESTFRRLLRDAPLETRQAPPFRAAHCPG